MARPQWEVADIVRDHAPAWRRDRPLNLRQLKALSAIERCRSAALGGHVIRCEQCHDDQIAYNSCRNRHCPKCQGSAAKRWLDHRQAELLPIAYYHVVFTVPAIIARIASQNPTVKVALTLRRKQNYRNIVLADDTPNETVGVVLKDGGVRYVMWKGFIDRKEALRNPHARPVKLQIYSFSKGLEQWTLLRDNEFIQGCIIDGDGVYGVVEENQLRVIV